MSGLLALLQQGAQSLQAQTSATATASHNLSNANTVGYSRQRAEIAATSPAERYANAYIGRGAVLQAVSQARDRFVEAQIPVAIGKEMMSGTEAQTLKGVTALDVDNGMAPAISQFYESLRSLAQNPSNQNYRTAAIGTAQQLAQTFNRTSQAIEGARTAIDSKVEGRLVEINQTAAQIARLNGEVAQARATGAEPNDLLDARLKLADRLAEMTGATPVPDKSGDLNLVMPGGVPLVSSLRASTLTARPDGANNGHLQLYLQMPDGSTPRAMTNLPGGELGGLISARDGALKTASTQTDQLAFEFANNVNTAARAGVALDGSAGRDVFVGVGTAAGSARNISVDQTLAADPNLFPAGSTAAPGDAGAVQAMIATETITLSTGTTVSGTLSRIASDFGAVAQRVATIHEGDSAMLSHLDSMRQSASGVSVDEELINMQKAQRAYEAVTRVIKTADEMLETLMSLK